LRRWTRKLREPCGGETALDLVESHGFTIAEVHELE
jgi:hypothetical protein